MTTSATRADAPLQPAGPAQDAGNRLKQVLAYHLLDSLVETLTDRHGTTHPFPWSPDQHVRVGVLGPMFNPPPAGAPPTSGPSGATSTNGASDGDGDGDRASGGDGVIGGSAPAVAPPIDNRGVIGVDFVVAADTTAVVLDLDVQFALYHPLVPPFPAVSAEASARAASAASSNRRRRPTVPISPSWERDNRRVTVSLRVPLGRDERQEQYSDLATDAAAAVTAHYTRPDALWKLTNNQTLPVQDALGTEAEFRQALNARRDSAWQPLAPAPHITVTTMPTVDGQHAVSVSVTNSLTLAGREIQDLAVYDTRMTVTVRDPAKLIPQRLGFAADDCRYSKAATVVGRGRGCVALPGDAPGTITAETLPLYVQQQAESSNHGIDITFDTLVHNHTATLDEIATAMRSFLRDWDTGTGRPASEQAQLKTLRDDFEREVERFELGCDLLRSDARLERAFILANETFARAKGPGAAWRLFQLAFIVTELGALAGRENPTDVRLRSELDAVDVLWFPTGGGKTEAYLGLIAVALFYDRLRDKLRGTTAWMLFPLRMLSVQQLARITLVVHHAEQLRVEQNIPGDAFTLGYLVGSSNTPNRLAFRDANGWWPGIDAFSQLSAQERDKRRLVGACPSCSAGDEVGLDTDLVDQRLKHICRSCGHVLSIHASDEEVTRYQPAVVVSTVDKITAFARNGELTSFNRGPRKRCPQHGWYTHKSCVAKDCTTAESTHTPPTGFLDPTPALWIQDELHLVREELGVFAGHYHTLLAELARGAGHEPSKVIAATATIEQYEDQLSQVYGRTPRLFPTGGPTLEESFYSKVTDNVRRLYLGVLPAGGGTVKVDLAGRITAQLVENVHEQMNDPTPLVASLAAAGITVTDAEARLHLFDYELALAYVNSKAHGVAIQEDLHRLSESLIEAGSDRVRTEYLQGDTTLGELAAAIAAIQDDTPGTPRADRIRALVGTSVVSHGVDLDRLNLEILAGMPPSYAHYIQATARAGRRHVGLVVSVFDRGNRRETSMYQSFATTHAALERMVEPVPVNRFASRAIERTLPGAVCALLWDETRSRSWGTTESISQTRKFRVWWNANAASLIPHLKQRLERAYRCPIADPAVAVDEQKLIDDVLARWENVERQRMQQWQAEWLTELFTSPAMTSLRDVDPPVEFSGGPRAEQIISRLFA